MQFILYYGEDGDPASTAYMRIFASREAALERALVLYRYGYDLYALKSENGEEMNSEQILRVLETACLPTLH